MIREERKVDIGETYMSGNNPARDIFICRQYTGKGGMPATGRIRVGSIICDPGGKWIIGIRENGEKETSEILRIQCALANGKLDNNS